MNKFKSHFVFNRSQQNGIFLLVAIIIVLQLVYFFYPFSSEVKPDPELQEQAARLQQKIDSLKQVAATEDSLQTTAAFNPNFITDYRGYVLGMSSKEIDRLHNFRNKGLWINSAEDFQRVTGVSDSLLNVISPRFQFPQRTSNASNISAGTNYPKRAFSEAFPKADLNSATAEELQKVNGIGEKFSARIVKYRQSIGGFRDEIQLNDVYGLSPEVIERVLRQFQVKETAVRQDLNSISVLELSELPYFNYELARAVIDLRKKQGKIASFEDLKQIKEFSDEKIERIKLYLTID